MEDALAVLAIRNSDAVRSASLDSQIIEKDAHLKWFENSLKNENRWILLAESEDQKLIGVLRYDAIADNGLEVSIFLNQEFMGQGLGSKLLDEGKKWINKHIKSRSFIEAKVLSGNIASLKTFLKSNFVESYKVYKLAL